MRLHSREDKWIKCCSCKQWMWSNFTSYDKEKNTYTCAICKCVQEEMEVEET